MNSPTSVPTAVYTKASASLKEEVAKELKINDPKEQALASLIKKSKDENHDSDERQG